MTRVQSGSQLDMTPDGRFVEPPAEPLADKILRYAVIVAVVAALAAAAALALWLALVLIPVALAGAAIAYAAFRWRLWQAGWSGGRHPGEPRFGG